MTRFFFFVVMVLLCAPSLAFADTITVEQKCICEFQATGAIGTTSETFTGTTWLNAIDTTTPQEPEPLCKAFCLQISTARGVTFVKSTYGEQESKLIPVIAPELGVAIPGLTAFSTAKEAGGKLSINFIGQYIVAVYEWLIGVMAVFAVIMIMVGGVQYMLAGGSQEGIKQARDRITHALIGMVILLGSYLLLQNTNPQLVIFKPLEISTVEGRPVETNVPGPIGTSSKLCETIEDCKNFCEKPNLVPEKTMGMATQSQVVELTAGEGLRLLKKEYLLPESKQKLESAGRIAASRGYTIIVIDAFRPLSGQVRLACNEILDAEKKKRTPNIPSAVAWPGGSAHGSGVALDIRLGNKDGGQLWQVTFATQRQAKLEYVKALAEIMYEAGWQRYVKEIWHFQTNGGQCISGQCFSYFGDEDCKCN